MCRTLACLLLALPVSSIGFGEEKPDAKELLKTYQRTVESMKQFGIEAESLMLKRGQLVVLLVPENAK